MSALSSALIGLGAGVGLSFLLLAVGAVRIVVALLLGTRINPPTAEDVRMVAYYVGGFGAAGLLIGALWPYLPGRAAKTVAFCVGGVIVVLALFLADQGGLTALDQTDLAFAIVFGCALGGAAAHGHFTSLP